jgi:hypothetical protein
MILEFIILTVLAYLVILVNICLFMAINKKPSPRR